MKSLADIYQKYKTPRDCGDRGTVHSYIEFYEELLFYYRFRAKYVLEIGIATGRSLRMWEEYFDDSCVFGVDISATGLQRLIREGGHHIFIFNATDRTQTWNYFRGTKFDVIIEDASHVLDDQVKIYQNFRQFLAPGGIYIIEDVGSRESLRAALRGIQPGIRMRLVDFYCKKLRFDDAVVVIRG